MDLILNDFSLNGQYESLDSFILELKENILPCLQLSSDLELSFLLKSGKSLDLQVTQTETVRSILKFKNNTVVQKILGDYAKYFLKGPFWESSIVTPESIVPNCKIETFYRNGILLSFIPSDGNEHKDLLVSIEGKDEIVKNATNVNQFLECLSDKGEYPLEYNFPLLGSDKIFMIHTGQSEDNHKDPHFHIKNSNGTKSTTVSLNTFDILVKKQFYSEQLSFFRKDIKIAMKEINKQKLIRLWNYLHPDKKIK